MTDDAPPSSPTDEKANQGFFPQTRWTLVLEMQEAESTQASADALNQLCQIYWRPVFVYIRSWGKSVDDAQDLTQGFFAMLLSKQSLSAVAPDKGKLRTFLLVALKRFMANAHAQASALKRGGGEVPISIDEEWMGKHSVPQMASHDAPDKLFDRQWALTVLERAMGQLKEVYVADGKADVFEALKFTISPDRAKRPLTDVATELGISESAAKVASHRLRKRYRERLQATIADTLGNEEEVEEEIRYLMEIFRS
jgi:RNA polymerase sigma-70 factor (ECF subfamily)